MNATTYRPLYGPGTYTRHYGHYADGDTATLIVSPQPADPRTSIRPFPSLLATIFPELSGSHHSRSVTPLPGATSEQYITAISQMLHYIRNNIGPEQFRDVTEYTEVYPCPTPEQD